MALHRLRTTVVFFFSTGHISRTISRICISFVVGLESAVTWLSASLSQATPYTWWAEWHRIVFLKYPVTKGVEKDGEHFGIIYLLVCPKKKKKTRLQLWLWWTLHYNPILVILVIFNGKLRRSMVCTCVHTRFDFIFQANTPHASSRNSHLVAISGHLVNKEQILN